MRRWLASVVVFVAACGSPEPTQNAPLGEIIGRIEIDQDVPQPGCRVLVEGTPRGALCDQQGQFSLRALDPGKWDLRIIANDADSIPSRRITTAANGGFITDLGAIRIARPGRIGGHLTVPPGQTAPFAVFSVPGFGVATSLDQQNLAYLLAPVPAGYHDVVLTTDRGDFVQQNVLVHPDGTTTGINFNLADLQQHDIHVVGTATVAGSDDHSNIVVELVETLGGTVVAHVTTGSDGAFVLPATSGVYLVRAHHPDHPLVATLPSVVVHGERDITLTNALVIPVDGDLDGDGIADADDPDADGDGVPNAQDAFPFDPAESKDGDGDGVGTNSDLDDNGDGVLDRAVPTPDTDHDGFLDFEDTCVNVANPDQLDSDGDHVGNVCDNCPGIANPDQADADHNGTGDACEACIAGAPCQPTNACSVGITRCTGLGAVCDDTLLPQPDGTVCGAGAVCFAGACAPCTNGGTCFTSTGGSCIVGVESCSTGMEQCLPTAAKLPDGSACGPGEVCDNGACVACTGGGACTYAPDACHQGRLSCATGLPQICEDSGLNAPDGTSCNGNQFCHTGVCEACAQGATCAPALAPCHVGAYACGTGVAVCTDQGANLPDGSACLGIGMFCSSGTCITSPNALSAFSGSPQTANVGALLAPITVKLSNGGGTPIANEPITVVPPPGAQVAVAPASTNSSGLTSFTLRLGPTAGPQVFQVLSNVAPPLALTMTATAVPTGGIFTVVNALHLLGNQGIPGPGSNVRLNYPDGMAVAPDGTIYVCSTYVHLVLKIDPSGNVTRIAGGGTGNPPLQGDGGQGVNATLSYPRALALDAAGNKLYIADTNDQAVRRLDLTTGIITTYAGRGNAPGPGFGDGGPANGANLSSPSNLALASSGVLYIVDSGHDQIRRVDTNGLISTVLDAQTCAAGAEIGISACGANCTLAIDAAGALFIAGQVCGSSPQGLDYGIVRRDADGSLHHIAGNLNGTSGNGAEAKNTNLAEISSMAFDSGGNLVFAEKTSSRIRRIDGTTGIVTAIAGTGVAGSAAEYATAATAPLDTPDSIGFLGTDLVVVEENDASIRRITSVDVATTSSISIAAVAATGSIEVDRLFPVFSAHLFNGAANYTGLRVSWSSPEPAAVIQAPWSLTDSAGIASTNLRPGLAVGAYHVVGTFDTIHGVPVTGSPVTFTLNATAPAPGTIFTAVNVAHSGASESGIPGPASLAGVSVARGIVAASDGTFYFSDDSHRIRKVTPAGIITTIAGIAGTSPLGDFGPATAAALYYPAGLALDDAGNKLYVADEYHNRIRMIDLTSGTIVTIAGGATVALPPYGDGGAGTSADLGFPERIALGPDNAIYVADAAHNSIRRISLVSPYLVSTVMTGGGCTGTAALAACSSYQCDLAWDGNALYISGTICPQGSVTQASGVIRLNPNMSITHILGVNAGSTAEGVPAVTATVSSPDAMTVIGGNVIYSDGDKLRTIVGGNVSTLAGAAVAGSTGDYGPATSALLSNPYAIVALPGGHLAFTDSSNVCVRIIW